MKATLETPDDLFKRIKNTAAMRRESLKEFAKEALQKYLGRPTASNSSQRGWRSVFGQARREEVEAVDVVISEELERIDPDEWR